MEAVCERENCKQALRRVKANKGSPGIDGMPVEQLSGHLKEHWPAIREQLLSGAGKKGGNPEAGRRSTQVGHSDGAGSVHPASGDEVRQRSWDGTFSKHSYGFRPGGRHIKRWSRRSNIKPKATVGWWMWISRSSSIGSTTTDCSRKSPNGSAISAC